MIFAGSSNKPLAEKIAKYLNLTLSPLEINVFPDGERRVRVLENVVDKDTFVVQSTCPPVDTNYMELFLIIDALKRSGAKSVTGIVPYLGYQRQDHIFRDGEAVSLEVVTQILQKVGLSKIICFDLHSVKVPEIFSIPVVHLSALPLFADKIKEITKAQEEEGVLVSPDMGGIRRIKLLSESLSNTPFATIVKNRDLETGEIIDSVIEGNVKGKTVFIIDDMISTGETIVSAAKILKEKGAGKIYVFATHGVLSDEAPRLLESDILEKVYLTDSVLIPKEKEFAKLETLSIADIIAQNLNSL
jgi:ribose-phosphate pyrophosphokinase